MLHGGQCGGQKCRTDILIWDNTYLYGIYPHTIEENWETNKVAVFLDDFWIINGSINYTSLWGKHFSSTSYIILSPSTAVLRENLWQSSLRWTVTFVPRDTPSASATSYVPDLFVSKIYNHQSKVGATLAILCLHNHFEITVPVHASTKSLA